MNQPIEEIELTILMPCLNEEGTIGKCITKAFDSIRKNGLSAEVVIADNGSTDNSVSIAENLGARVVSVNEKGYGSALKAGIREAKGKYIIMGDSDCSYDFGEISTFIDRLREGYDLVMGNRFKGGIKKGAMPFLHRYLGNPVLSFIGRLFFRSSIGDFHCGLRGFNRQSIRNIDLTTTGMEFASEMVVKATLNKLKITEVPTILYPDERNKPPHLNTWSDGWRHLRFLLIFSPRWLFLFPGIFMLLVGLLFSVIIGLKQVSLNNVNFDVHTLLYSITFFYIGYQFVSFYIFTRYFGISNGLLPYSKRFSKFLYYLTLERGIFIGLFFLLLGFIFSIHALQIWKESGFGGLNPSEVFRIVIPASFSIIVGMQTILNSFFLSILGLRK
jgi:glycosyltransferase involved in cell wall biosynthesis